MTPPNIEVEQVTTGYYDDEGSFRVHATFQNFDTDMTEQEFLKMIRSVMVIMDSSHAIHREDTISTIDDDPVEGKVVIQLKDTP